MTTNDEPFPCPVCGAEVPAKAKACPGCGADERTGWRDDVDDADDADLPAGYEGEDDFDYKDFVRREFGRPKAASRTWLWIAVVVAAALLIVAFVALTSRAP